MPLPCFIGGKERKCCSEGSSCGRDSSSTCRRRSAFVKSSQSNFRITLLRKRNQTLFHFSYLGKIKRAQLALSSRIRGKIVVFVVSRTLVSLPPSAGPPLDLGLAMAAPRVSLLLIAHSERCFAPPSATMMPFICSVVFQDPPLGDGLFAPTVTPEVGGSSTKAPRHPSGLHLR